MLSAERIKAILESALPDCVAIVRDDANDGEHFSADVVCTSFEDLPRVRQHQLVYAALGEHMKRDIHALALKTWTPDAWKTR
jgi:acid stress-induced BolA-like protein IbaG/YrbA